MKVFVIFLLLFFSLFFLNSNNDAYGLSCAITNMTGHFEESDTIFLGKALSKEYQPNPRHEDRFDAVTLFSIIEPYKGIYQKEIKVISSEWLWGVNFTENSDYVVFANNNDEGFEHALCTLTQLASESNLSEIRKISQNYILPPLSQIDFGVNPNEVQCKDNLVLVQKYDGSPACVTEQTKQKLIERGWTGYDVSATYDYTIKTGGVTYGSQYQISGGTVDEIVYDEDRNSLFISLDGTKQGYIQIVIQTGLLHHPRELPFNYIVIIDGEEIEFEQLSPVILRIPFEKEDQQIEIVGTIEK